MKRVLLRAALAIAMVLAAGAIVPVRSAELAVQHQTAVDKGLHYLAKTQYPDGHWEANGGRWPTAMTAMAGTALLMEGSTIRDGKYAEKIRKATDWLMERAQRSGLIGDARNPTETSHYMHGHGYALLFLAQVYGEEEDSDRRKKLEKILTEAVKYCGHAQTKHGGWGYVSAKDSNDFDEGSTTITQVQALRAARNVGIVVPKGIVDRAIDYLKKCTTRRGGIVYSMNTPKDDQNGRPPLTAAAVACMFCAGEYQHEYAKKWLKYCQETIPTTRAQPGLIGQHWEYTQYYYAQSIYMLGDKGYAKLFPESRESDRLTWTKYKDGIFDSMVSQQAADGSWNMSGIGPVYSTAFCLTIFQLEGNTLALYQR